VNSQAGIASLDFCVFFLVFFAFQDSVGCPGSVLSIIANAFGKQVQSLKHTFFQKFEFFPGMGDEDASLGDQARSSSSEHTELVFQL
jgi:hypothetical protein